MTCLISRLIDSCAFKYQFPSRSPRTTTKIPGNRKIGVNNTIAPRFMREVTVISMSHIMVEGTEVSTTRMSCVHLAIMRAVGVSSSHLYIELTLTPEDYIGSTTNRKVLLKTEFTSFS